jgi:hypothetical protein
MVSRLVLILTYNKKKGPQTGALFYLGRVGLTGKESDNPTAVINL